MNKLEQAARQALEALIKANHFHDYEDEITALRKALEQQAEQEPVAWMRENEDCTDCFVWERDEEHTIPLYTTPPTCASLAAQAARQMRDAAVKVCREAITNFPSLNSADWVVQQCAEAVESLPVPEVQWRDLTDDDIADVFWDDFSKQREEDYTWNDVARAVIAKFKEVNK